MRTGVIIAGGRSTRFGETDKAVADLAGTPMIRRVADRIEGAVDALVVNCRTEQVPAIQNAMAGYPHGVTFAEDDETDRGPMAAIGTGLAAVSSEYAFVVACDMPLVDDDLVEYLFERAAGHDAAVPRLDDKWFQTTHAVYRAEPMAAACEDALARGERKIIEPLFELDYVIVEEPELRANGDLTSFENANTREELGAIAERF